ncbi:pilus motility taxis protein HmpF [Dolichospermum circinale]|uniref:pilus motility taxis protein HmpF n=1 Tax=Dolichospermum circinale TaxID=109265 RepID=UPI00041BB65D|nr:pilus motility taxis protein HmpF [Dolichospermum circinale]MDB9474466.1 pilus motility taxis protein HmpF [Dolichospermum circinale CS-537/11]MDB9478447.1 pilus motility taxis protein HmpF [Dolichospermum circinale CS-537/03]MDB9481489.1 pilus motility taxis protein HmpF [Dolichospermum circinale CS-537/05]
MGIDRVLYLAELQKLKTGLLGVTGKTELKLLACQHNEQNWSPVPKEVIVSNKTDKFNHGALVLVELSANRQIQRIEEANLTLVNILQNFSRQVARFKLKESEIEQWKYSLRIQAEEFNRRQNEIESRWQEIQSLENEFQNLDRKKQLVETSRTEIDYLRAEMERSRQDLEGAWQHLRGEQRRLQEMTLNSQQTQMIEEISGVFGDSVNGLSSETTTVETIREILNSAFAFIDKQQDNMNLYWQRLDIESHAAKQQQNRTEELLQTLNSCQEELQQAENDLTQQINQVQSKTAIFNSKRELTVMLKRCLGTEEEFYQKLYTLAAYMDFGFSKQVDVEALQQIPLEELKKMVQDSVEKLDRDSEFVEAQEQELRYKQELIAKLQQRIQDSYGQEKINLESELAEVEDIYKMLNKSLIGQRCNLIDQQKNLRKQQIILHQKQGFLTNLKGEYADLGLVVLQLETHKQERYEEIKNLESYIAQILIAIEADQQTIDLQTQKVERKRQEVKFIEEEMLNLRTATNESCGRINVYQEILQSLQDDLDGSRNQLQKIAQFLEDICKSP